MATKKVTKKEEQEAKAKQLAFEEVNKNRASIGLKPIKSFEDLGEKWWQQGKEGWLKKAKAAR